MLSDDALRSGKNQSPRTSGHGKSCLVVGLLACLAAAAPAAGDMSHASFDWQPQTGQPQPISAGAYPQPITDALDAFSLQIDDVEPWEIDHLSVIIQLEGSSPSDLVLALQGPDDHVVYLMNRPGVDGSGGVALEDDDAGPSGRFQADSPVTFRDDAGMYSWHMAYQVVGGALEEIHEDDIVGQVNSGSYIPTAYPILDLPALADANNTFGESLSDFYGQSINGTWTLLAQSAFTGRDEPVEIHGFSIEATLVPEPGTLALLTAGLALLCARRRRGGGNTGNAGCPDEPRP